MRFSIRLRATKSRLSISLIRHPAGALTKTCSIKGREERAILPKISVLIGTSRQPTIESVSRCSSSSTMRRHCLAILGSWLKNSIPTA